MASITLPSETAASMIADAVRQRIEQEIERAVRTQIDPRIKEICAAKAREVCDAAQVVMHQNMIDPFGSIVLHISFNGEKFNMADLTVKADQSAGGD